jgi:hypothetical protein
MTSSMSFLKEAAVKKEPLAENFQEGKLVFNKRVS